MSAGRGRRRRASKIPPGGPSSNKLPFLIKSVIRNSTFQTALAEGPAPNERLSHSMLTTATVPAPVGRTDPLARKAMDLLLQAPVMCATKHLHVKHENSNQNRKLYPASDLPKSNIEV